MSTVLSAAVLTNEVTLPTMPVSSIFCDTAVPVAAKISVPYLRYWALVPHNLLRVGPENQLPNEDCY